MLEARHCINSSLAGVYKNAIERGFDKVYGNAHSLGLLDEQYVDLSTQIHSERTEYELLKRTPSGLF